jgi:hypothetical protein
MRPAYAFAPPRPRFRAAAPAPAAPVNVFRTALTLNDPDRDWTLAWARSGPLGRVYDLVQAGRRSGSMPSDPIASGYNDDAAYYGRFDVPPGTAAGAYLLDTGGGTAILTIAADVPRRPLPAPIPPGRSAAALADAVRKNFTDVTLAPGLHEWDATVALPAWMRVRGYGASLRRLPLNNVGTNWPAFWVQGRNVTVEGVTFLGEYPGAMVFFANPPLTDSGLVVKNCTFRNVNFGFFLCSALIQDSEFVGGGAVIAPSGLWWRVLFNGRPTQHAWDYWFLGAGERVAQVDCVYRGTDRGRVFNSGWGPVTDGLFVNTEYTNVYSVGGGEMDSCEGPNEFSRHAIRHTRANGCRGAIQLSGNGNESSTPVRDVLLSDLTMDGGWGLILWSTLTSGVRLEEFEFLNGAGVWLDRGCSGTRLVNGEVRGWFPSRGTAGFKQMSPVALGRTAACVNLGADNTTTNVAITNTTSGYSDQIGFRTGPGSIP